MKARFNDKGLIFLQPEDEHEWADLRQWAFARFRQEGRSTGIALPAEMIEELSQDKGETLKEAIQKAIRDEMQPGGLLNPACGQK
jgi:hypothetical protein